MTDIHGVNLGAFIENAGGFELTAHQREILDRIGQPFRMNVSFERARGYGITMRTHDLYYLSRVGAWYRHPGPHPLPIDGAAYRARINRRRKK